MNKAFSGFVIVSVVIYSSVVFYMLFLGFGRGMVIMSEHMLDNYNYRNSINLIPFKTITEYISNIFDGSIRGAAIRNIYGNIFLFFPAGFYLPFFAKKMSKAKTYSFVMAALIIMVEVIQLVSKSGSMDIDDFILNFVGALIGLFAFTRTSMRSLFKLRTW